MKVIVSLSLCVVLYTLVQCSVGHKVAGVDVGGTGTHPLPTGGPAIHPGFTTENTFPKYKVSFVHGKPAHHPKARIIPMSSRGTQYKCAVPPKVETEEEEAAKVKEKKSRGVWPYLEHLAKTCFYRIEGWWSIELCLFDKIRQYHQENKQVTAEFVLGLYTDKLKPKPKFNDQGEPDDVSGYDAKGKPYFALPFEDGTTCDLTGKPRRTEVRFFCSKDDANSIDSNEEVSTCTYVLAFHTPYLCHHPDFKDESPTDHTIQCWQPSKYESDEPVPSDSDTTDQADAALASAATTSTTTTTTPPLDGTTTTTTTTGAAGATADGTTTGTTATSKTPFRPPAPLFSDVTAKTVVISWQPSGEGPRPTGYRLITDSGRGGELNGMLYDGLGTEMEIADLQPGVTYAFAVVPYNQDGEGMVSPVAKVTTAGGASLAAPLAPRAEQVTANSAFLRWSPPKPVAGVNPPTRYKVFWNGPEGGATQAPARLLTETDATTYYYSARNLKPDTTYRVALVHVNNQGDSPMGADVMFQTKALGPPEAPPFAPSFSQVTSTSLKLAWQPPKFTSSPLIGYRIYWNGPDAATTEANKVLISANILTYRVAGLTPGKGYVFRIVAYNAQGDSQPSPPGSIVTPSGPPPAQPPAPRISGVTHHSILIQWQSAPKGEGGDVTGYKLYWNQGGNGAPNTQLYQGPGTQWQATGLQPGTEYKFAVVASNKAGDSQSSAISATRTDSSSAGAGAQKKEDL